MSYMKASKRLSYLLRHSQDPLYIDLNGGWAPVSTILQLLNLTRAELDQIVAEDTKGRYSYDDTGSKIRANQGHSIKGVMVDMERPEPPELLYHGTATRFLDDILREGLKPMSRQFVHISPDFETAIGVGKRHGKPVVLAFRARDFVSDGHDLFRSANGVWQAAAVPPEYLEICGGSDEKIRAIGSGLIEKHIDALKELSQDDCCMAVSGTGAYIVGKKKETNAQKEGKGMSISEAKDLIAPYKR